METTKLLQGWESIKNRVHDISGIEHPERWMFENINGIFYPVEEIQGIVEDRDFEELNPDWTDEELIEHGWTVKHTVLIGDDSSINFREGCGQMVLDTEESKPERKAIGFGN